MFPLRWSAWSDWRWLSWPALGPVLPLVVTVFAGGVGWLTRLAAVALLLSSAVTAQELRGGVGAARSAAAVPMAWGTGTSDAKRSVRERLQQQRERALQRWESRMNHGWSASSAAALMEAASSEAQDPEYRLGALTAVCEHHAARRRERGSARLLELDIVLVSTLDLLGGTTSSNEAEIQAFRDAGLRVGLVHHPVYSRTAGRPVHPRLLDLVDDEQVFLLGPADTVRCDLAIVKFPVALEHLMEDRPRISANRTVLLVNQAPFEEYGLTGGYGTSWSITDVHRNVSEWLGEHTWYAIGPAIRDVLAKHHAEELAGIDQALDFWYETIDVEAWRPQAPRVRGEGDPIRIGRHSRDHVTKFPNMARRLRTAYPDAEDIEVHMLGGEQALLKILGAIPPRWTSHPFGTKSPVDFLGEVDVYVYFIDENLLEAFGRSPLEAIAAGVPCILPWSFEELFGDAGVYCEAEDVEERARALMADPAAYERQVRAGRRVIEERFSPRALLRRVSGLGVAVDPKLLHRTETDFAMTMEEIR